MAKNIRLTQEEIEQIKLEFDQALNSAISDGKINFQKTLGIVQRKAELQFTELAWLKMQSLIRECDKEVGWHGIAKRVEDAKDTYIIEDILVYPQEVSGCTVTPDQEKYQMWLMMHDDEVFNNIRMQGHSHVNMATSPSGVDTTFYESILSQLDETMFYIFMIWNKRSDKYIRIYDMAENVVFDTNDVTIRILPMENGIEEFLKDAESRITERQAVPQVTTVKPVTTAAAASTVGNSTVTTSYDYYGNAKKKQKKQRVSSPWTRMKDDDDDDDPYGPFGYSDGYSYRYY